MKISGTKSVICQVKFFFLGRSFPFPVIFPVLFLVPCFFFFFLGSFCSICASHPGSPFLQAVVLIWSLPSPTDFFFFCFQPGTQQQRRQATTAAAVRRKDFHLRRSSSFSGEAQLEVSCKLPLNPCPSILNSRFLVVVFLDAFCLNQLK